MTQQLQTIKYERVWAMPNKNTFEIEPIRKLITEEETDSIWIDPFARDSHLADITNDINPKTKAMFHLDAIKFLRLFPNASIGGCLYDAIYSPRQLSECYKELGIPVTSLDTTSKTWSIWKKEIARVIKPGGKVISFGWNSNGIGIKLGFGVTRILMVAHGGSHNDTICTVERRIQETLF